MQYGFFDDKRKEYVIETPATPMPWINYLGSQEFFSLISNTAGGYCFYRDAKLQRILRYRYRGQTVYYVPPSCCDQPGILYDEAGTQVCEPDGGISGRGDGRCTDFHEQRSAESLIWSDSRGWSPSSTRQGNVSKRH